MKKSEIIIVCVGYMLIGHNAEVMFLKSYSTDPSWILFLRRVSMELALDLPLLMLLTKILFFLHVFDQKFFVKIETFFFWKSKSYESSLDQVGF